jgi:hypothetical protein
MKARNLLFIISWVILLVVSAMVVLYSALSLWRAYTRWPDRLTPEYSIAQIQEQGGEEAVKAFRGRRATAATLAIGFGLLSLIVTWVPYRRGERWAWWALFMSIGLSQLLSLARAVMLVTTLGLGAPALILAFSLLGLMAGAPTIFSHTKSSLTM